MPILDDDEQVKTNVENHTKETICDNIFWDDILSTYRATGIEADCNSFVADIQVAISKADNAPVKRMQQHAGRKVYTLDCRKLCKYDAIGWLRSVSQLPLSPKPILVIENITEIPKEDEVHDNPQYVQNLLVHSWKNETNDFTDNRPGQNYEQFTINPRNYTVFLTWTPETKEMLNSVWSPSDGYAWIGNFNEHRQKFIDEYMRKTCQN
ncbi:MAG: hypothetical protein IJ776_02940 [Paludibacteraceae bacterium]|nr:hypothetical protein [Paludibacteraceae bacterium]